MAGGRIATVHSQGHLGRSSVAIGGRARRASKLGEGSRLGFRNSWPARTSWLNQDHTPGEPQSLSVVAIKIHGLCKLMIMFSCTSWCRSVSCSSNLSGPLGWCRRMCQVGPPNELLSDSFALWRSVVLEDISAAKQNIYNMVLFSQGPKSQQNTRAQQLCARIILFCLSS